ncbi:MAG: hypothetical protein ACK55P_04530, partial [Planctomyces sp.]
MSGSGGKFGCSAGFDADQQDTGSGVSLTTCSINDQDLFGHTLQQTQNPPLAAAGGAGSGVRG